MVPRYALSRMAARTRTIPSIVRPVTCRVVRPGSHLLCAARRLTTSVRVDLTSSSRSFTTTGWERNESLSVSPSPSSSSARSPGPATGTLITNPASSLSRTKPGVGKETHVTASEPSAPSVRFDEKVLEVGWASGSRSGFHHIWLRDHCRCAECFHPKTKQRLLETWKVPADIRPEWVGTSVSGMTVKWQGEKHESTYPWQWLMRNSYDVPLLETDRSDTEKTLWGRGISAAPPTVTYKEVMGDDRGVFRWLSKISEFGFCFVEGVPPTPEDTERLVQRIAFIRPTHYGGFWDFTSNLEHGDTAYTNLKLPAHTDTTYFTDPAGLQLFHLLEHSGEGARGGESLFVDGFYTASILREVHPSSYELLSRTRIPAHSAGNEDTLIRPLPSSGYPIFNHDPTTEELVQVRYNNDDRSVMNTLEPHKVEAFYEALRRWEETLRSEDSEYWTKLVPGTALIFDNHRVLHGRASFVGKRRLCGAYVNADDYKSRLEVLRRRYSDDKGERDVWDEGL